LKSVGFPVYFKKKNRIGIQETRWDMHTTVGADESANGGVRAPGLFLAMAGVFALMTLISWLDGDTLMSWLGS
jgi:hypothetical protein